MFVPGVTLAASAAYTSAAAGRGPVYRRPGGDFDATATGDRAMKRHSMHTLAAAGALAGAMALGGPAAAQTSWDLPLAWPDGNFHTENAKIFAERVEEETGGEVTINIHAGGALGFKGPEMATAVRDGLVPIGDALLNNLMGDDPLFGLEAQPYLVEGFEELAVLHEHFRPMLDELAEEYNQKVLYVVPWPRQYVYTKREVNEIGDLRGVKIRTYNPSTTEMFNRVGMTSVQLPWGEVVPALAAGTIDAVTTSATSGVDGKFWEFLDYMYPTNHVWSSNMVSVNLDAWNALSEENREIIQRLAEELEPEFWEVSRQEDVDMTEVLLENGIVMGDVSDEMTAEMQERTRPMIAEYIEDAGPRAEEVISAFLADVGRSM